MTVRIITGDALQVLGGLGDQTFDCVVTSPPYWTQRDYGVEGQIGLEATIEEHLDRLSEVLGEVRRVLRRDGNLWLNYGDAYNTCNGGQSPNAFRLFLRKRGRQPVLATGFGLKTKTVKRKSLMGLPWRLALRLEAEGWYLRSDVIWRKPNPVECSDVGRPKKAHEYVFLLAKSEMNFFRGSSESVWEFAPEHVRGHPAPFPQALVRRCLELGCRPGGQVLDPFGGSGTVGLVADQLGLDATLIDLNPEYSEIARRRIYEDAPLLTDVTVVRATEGRRTP